MIDISSFSRSLVIEFMWEKAAWETVNTSFMSLFKNICTFISVQTLMVFKQNVSAWLSEMTNSCYIYIQHTQNKTGVYSQLCFWPPYEWKPSIHSS